MIEIDSVKQFRELASQEKLFCAFFTAKWCPDCVVIKPALPGLIDEFQDRYNFASVDRDKFMELAQEYDIMGIPSLVVYQNGEVFGRFVSKFQKTRQQLADFLEEVSPKQAS